MDGFGRRQKNQCGEKNRESWILFDFLFSRVSVGRWLDGFGRQLKNRIFEALKNDFGDFANFSRALVGGFQATTKKIGCEWSRKEWFWRFYEFLLGARWRVSEATKNWIKLANFAHISSVGGTEELNNLDNFCGTVSLKRAVQSPTWTICLHLLRRHSWCGVLHRETPNNDLLKKDKKNGFGMRPMQKWGGIAFSQSISGKGGRIWVMTQ